MRVRRSLAAALAVGAATTALTVTAGPAYAVADNVCDGVDATTPRGHTGRPSVPLVRLGVPAAQDQVKRFAPASPQVRVAVLSSGIIEAGEALPIAARVDVSGAGGEVTDPQGTAIGGLVAGQERADGQLVGVAPDAGLVDVRVFVDRDSNEPAELPATPKVTAGLRWVAEQAKALNIKVAVVPFVVRESPSLREAVVAAQKVGVVLVAASGDRPAEGSEFSSEFDNPPAKDEDAGPLFFPAGFPGVVAVNAADPGSLESVVKNSRTSVAAPAYDAVSYGLNGVTCLVRPTSTGAAAGEVAGVLALLWQRYPKSKPAQVVARLENTADGTTDDPTPLTGYGVVQPYEALTRPLRPSKTGEVERTVVREEDQTRATAPEPEDDLLASTRENAVWWGLIGGGVLLVALMLRPVLARRR